MTGRALILLGLFVACFAACDGTEGWVIRERAAAGGQTSPTEAGAAGEPGLANEAGTGGDAEAAGAAGAPEPPPPHCPTRFESNCSPGITVVNKDAATSGHLFSDAIPDPAQTLDCIARDMCDVLFRKTTEIRALTQILVIVEDFDGVSETYSSGPESATIHMSSRHLQSVADAKGDVASEIKGILYYQTTNIYQSDAGDGVANSWVVQGVAIYIRHGAGYVPDSERQPGGKYDDGGNTTGFFLVWLDTQYPDFVYALNQSLATSGATPWSAATFRDITGQSVTDLWAAYQASF